MKLENIYNKLNNINENENFIEVKLLLEEIKQAILEESCLKTTSKSKINAIKRVLKNVDDFKAVYKGWKKYGEYKVICDGYQLYMMKNVDIPAKEVVEEIPEGENKENYILGAYLNVENIFPEQYSERINLDTKEILTAVKTKQDMIKITTENNNIVYANPLYIKNAIEILGENVKIYYTGEIKPIVFENEEGEKGMVLPIRPPRN